MSRIGRAPIPKPDDVTVDIDGTTISVTGPKGTLTRQIRPEITVRVEDKRILVERPDDSKFHRSIHGLTRTLIANMVEGVTKGFTKVLEVHGVGYKVETDGDGLKIFVGYSHPKRVTPLPGIKFKVTQDVNTKMPIITVFGIDKEIVGQQAAKIRAIRKPEPYKGKGIRYSTEYVRRKVGKTAKTG